MFACELGISTQAFGSGPLAFARNVVDELTYQIRSNMGPSALHPFHPGGYDPVR